MSFHAPDAFQNALSLGDDRLNGRVGLYLPVIVMRPGHDSASAVLTDVSQNGCNILASVPMMVGKHLLVQVPAFSPFSGWVVWQTRKELGLAFATAVSRAEVEYIVDVALRTR